ncbi:ahpC/TSA family protein [Lyngbya aestuarii BL J]|uniref:thioredoxin-dependent peroxiredoxin n=1 Tax=Lyngbya aestuarii BL J TaxID=1348334 RepID=U7QNI0_9CYAN|nr:peroxiredoxin-like family protein [Lyngbya aestuarii]ERT09408.1 ahpC/TSA family protein [Lyngbya aestuarii BL J]
MNLTQELQNLQNKLRANHPEDIKAVMDQATEDLVKSGLVEKALKVGDQAPNFQLPNAVGETVEFKKLFKSGPVVIAFYRGEWCPYCNLELRTLQKYLPEIEQFHAKLVAISPQIPDHSLSTLEKNELTFEVLSDVGNQVARKFGLVFTLPEELRPIYQKFGIDIPAHNGNKTFELPIAATYVIDQNGIIVQGFVKADYTQRLDPEEILATLKNFPVAV